MSKRTVVNFSSEEYIEFLAKRKKKVEDKPVYCYVLTGTKNFKQLLRDAGIKTNKKSLLILPPKSRKKVAIELRKLFHKLSVKK